MSIVNEGGVDFEALEYPRRRAGVQIAPLVYTPQLSRDMNFWQGDGITTTTSDFPAEMNALNGVWEMAVSRRAAGTVPPGRGFGRVGVRMAD